MEIKVNNNCWNCPFRADVMGACNLAAHIRQKEKDSQYTEDMDLNVPVLPGTLNAPTPEWCPLKPNGVEITLKANDGSETVIQWVYTVKLDEIIGKPFSAIVNAIIGTDEMIAKTIEIKPEDECPIAYVWIRKGKNKMCELWKYNLEPYQKFNNKERFKQIESAEENNSQPIINQKKQDETSN